MFGDFANKPEYIELFVEEAMEHVTKINQLLVELEKDMTKIDSITDVFRSIHTIKGMSGTMGFSSIEQLCTTFENKLDNFRSDSTKLTQDELNGCFSIMDNLENLVKSSTLTNNSQVPDTNNDFASNTFEHTIDLPTIRVKMDDLDKLVNLVGELTLMKMRLREQLNQNSHEINSNVFEHFERICSELQDHSMKIRLIPLEQAFSRLPRIIRDVSTKLGKQVDFEIMHSDAELDRTVVDNIMDPILHILRNSIDHGIEPIDIRKKIKKPEKGRIRLNAYRISDKVCIEINDDGAGIDIQKLKELAVTKNLFPTTHPDAITDEQILDILGSPGLSTSSNVTDISGRGVGFNVVRENIRKIGGQLKIHTEKNVGTTMIITLPMSLSIMKGLVVRSGSERFVFPLSKIKTVTRINSNSIFYLRGKEVMQLRDAVVPLIRLDQILNLHPNSMDTFTVLVIEHTEKLYGVIVDSYEHKQDIVTSNITNNQNVNKLFSNATILEDGNPSLIIDAETLIREGILQ